jgi:hypothetical protein
MLPPPPQPVLDFECVRPSLICTAIHHHYLGWRKAKVIPVYPEQRRWKFGWLLSRIEMINAEEMTNLVKEY